MESQAEKLPSGSSKSSFDIPLAPTLRPSKAEWEDPLAYIREIRRQGYHKYGIVKIKPPEDYKPPFAINKQTFRFSTRVQSINELQRRHIIAAKSAAFKAKLESFHRSRGQKPPKMPIMYGQQINTFKLYSAVVKRGGYDSVTHNKKWREVGRLVCSKHKQITNLSFLVRVAYERSLLDFEQYVEECLDYLKLDTSHLDALSTVCKGGGDREAGRMHGMVEGDEEEEHKEHKQEEPLNENGVKAEVKVKDELGENGLENNSSLKQQQQLCEENGDHKDDDNTDTASDTEMEALDGLIVLTSTRSSKRRHSQTSLKEESESESSSASEDGDEADQEEMMEEDEVVEKSELKKKIIRNGFISQDKDMEFIEQMLPKTRDDDEESLNLEEVFCELCGGGAHEDQIILCDKCDKGFHTFCLAPPLEEIPQGEWLCPHCISTATDELAFQEGSEFSVEEFQKWDRNFRDSHFLGKGTGSEKLKWWEVENEFWDIVENSDEPVEVHYGADLDSGNLGSGFPHEKHGFSGKYAEHPWNLNNLPRATGKYCSMLRHVSDNINGVIVPWLYMGMTFSSFCWHVEDHMFYSINYNHIGDPKIWYGVPSNSALAFEDVFRNYMPEQFKLQPDLLFQLVTMLSPRILKAASVPVYRVVQEEGCYVITFPRAYHGGFNCGFNCAEAVNFAPADWFEFDQDSIERYREFRRNPVLSHEALLCKVCEDDASPITASTIHVYLKEMIMKEAALRQESFLYAKRFKKVDCTAAKPGPGFGDDDAECAICKQYMHLSACTCKCSPGYHVCLEDIEKMCSCESYKRTIVYRRTLADLEDMYTKLLSRIEGCDVKQRMSEEFGKYWSESPRRIRESEMWIKSASGLLKEGMARRSQVEELLLDAEKFLWGGHFMDHVRELVEKLKGVLGWGDEVASCLSAKRRKLQLEYVQNLVKVSPKPLDVDLSRLHNWVEESLKLNGVAARILDFADGKSFNFVEVKDVLKSANSSVIMIPLLQELTSAVQVVQGWCTEVNDLLDNNAPNKPPFSVLSSYKHKGSLFAWQIEEKVDLQEATQRVESFQEKADVLLEKKPTLKELKEFVRQGESIPVSIPQWEEVQRRVSLSTEWISKANNVRLTLSNVRQLRTLLHSGVRIPVSFVEVDQLRLDIRKLEWTDMLSKTLKSKSKGTVSNLESLIDEGLNSLGMDASHELLISAREKLDRIVSWDEKAKPFLDKDISLQYLEELVKCGSEIGAMSETLRALTSRVSNVNKWKAKVSPILEQLNREAEHRKRELPVDLEKIDELEGSADHFIRQTVEYGELLQRKNQAKSWIESNVSTLPDTNDWLLTMVAGLIDGVPVQHKLEEVKALVAAGGASVDRFLTMVADLIDGVPVQHRLEEVKALVAAGIEIGVDSPILRELRLEAQRLEWFCEWLTIKHVSKESGYPLTMWRDHIAKGESLELSMADLELREAIYIRTLEKFRMLFASGEVTMEHLESYRTEFKAIGLRESKEEMESRNEQESLSLDISMETQAEGKSAVEGEENPSKGDPKKACWVPVGFSFSGIRDHRSQDVDDVIDEGVLNIGKMIDDLHWWESAILKLMNRNEIGYEPVYYGFLLNLKEQFLKGCYSKDKYQHHILCVETCLDEANKWREDLKRAVVKQNKCKDKDCIGQALDAISSSIDFPTGIFQVPELNDSVVATNESQELGDSGPLVASNQMASYQALLSNCTTLSPYCVCRKKIAKRGQAFECDRCHSRFHNKCLYGALGTKKLHPEDIARLGGITFDAEKLCPLCLAEFGVLSPLWKILQSYQNLSSCYSTKCPDAETLVDLHKAGRTLPFKMEEIDKLGSIVRSVGKWSLYLQMALLRQDDFPRMVIVTAFKFCMSMEIRANYATDLFQGLFFPVFYKRVESLLQAKVEGKETGKVSLDFLRDCTKEAGDVMGAGCDIVSRLTAEDEAACAWIAKADKIIDDHSYTLDEAKIHFEEAKSLVVDVSDILEDLKYRCTLYCVCKTPYDTNRPMLACDRCEEWFHYECVGLTPPGDEEGEAEGVSFFCKSCTLKQTELPVQAEALPAEASGPKPEIMAE